MNTATAVSVDGIGRLDVEELRLQQPRQAERRDRARRRARRSSAACPAPGPSRARCRVVAPSAMWMPISLRPLGDRVRQDAVGPDRRERQRERRRRCRAAPRGTAAAPPHPRTPAPSSAASRSAATDPARDRLLDLRRERRPRGSAERTTTFMFAGANPVRRGPCSLRKYSSVPVFLSMPPCFTSRTTPTIVNGRRRGRTRASTRWPIASSLRKPKNVFASVSLTSTTGAAGDVGRLEAAPLHDRNAHRLQVVERDGLVVVDVLRRAASGGGV